MRACLQGLTHQKLRILYARARARYYRRDCRVEERVVAGRFVEQRRVDDARSCNTHVVVTDACAVDAPAGA